MRPPLTLFLLATLLAGCAHPQPTAEVTVRPAAAAPFYAPSLSSDVIDEAVRIETSRDCLGQAPVPAH